MALTSLPNAVRIKRRLRRLGTGTNGGNSDKRYMLLSKKKELIEMRKFKILLHKRTGTEIRQHPPRGFQLFVHQLTNGTSSWDEPESVVNVEQIYVDDGISSLVSNFKRKAVRLTHDYLWRARKFWTIFRNMLVVWLVNARLGLHVTIVPDGLWYSSIWKLLRVNFVLAISSIFQTGFTLEEFRI